MLNPIRKTTSSPLPEKTEQKIPAESSREKPKFPLDAFEYCNIPTLLQPAREQRLKAMQDFKSLPKHSPAVPKDLSCQIKTLFISCANQTTKSYALTFLEVAKLHDFKVHIAVNFSYSLINPFTSFDKKYAQIEKISEKLYYEWGEDNGHFSLDKTICIPSQQTPKEYSYLLTNAFRIERILRLNYQECAEDFRKKIEDPAIPGVKYDRNTDVNDIISSFYTETPAEFGWGGQVYLREGQNAKIALSASLSYPLRECYTVGEGGNILNGILPDFKLSDGLIIQDEPFVLIGLDSVAFTRAHLKYQFKKEFNDEELRVLFSKDFGTEPENTLFIEQPGDFHLDMYLMLLRKGEVIIHDPQAAAELNETWLKASDDKKYLPEIKQLKKRAKQHESWYFKKIVEVVTSHKHLTCERFPLAFAYPLMNFANGEGGTDPQGNSFFITNGGKSAAEAYVEEKLFKPRNIKVYFVARKASKNSLECSGGGGCLGSKEGSISKATPSKQAFDVDHKLDEYQKTAFMLACEGDDKEAAKMLLKAKADPNKKDKDGNSALALACMSGHLDIVKFLLKNAKTFKINLNSSNLRGETPFMLACDGNHENIALLLLEAGIDANLQNKKGRSTFVVMHKNGNDEMLEFLRKNAEKFKIDTTILE